MIYTVPEDFQVRLDAYNAANPGPAYIALAWHPEKLRWQVFAVPTEVSYHPLARNDATMKLVTSFPDQSGRRGVLLNTWQGAEGEFLPLDERLFEALAYADSFRDREHFERTINGPAAQKELAHKRHLRDIAASARSYWWKLDQVIKNMNPAVSSPGDWRASKPWR